MRPVLSVQLVPVWLTLVMMASIGADLEPYLLLITGLTWHGTALCSV